jgi:hypothetical protein
MAYYKMVYLANRFPTECGGWGVADDPDAPLRINSIQLTEQRASAASIKFDAADINRWKDEKVAEGKDFEQFGRVWVHTHPGNTVHPSSDDVESFESIVRHQVSTNELAAAILPASEIPNLPEPWAIMVIVGTQGALHAEIGFIWHGEFMRHIIQISSKWDDTTTTGWDAAYEANVSKFTYQTKHHQSHFPTSSDTTDHNRPGKVYDPGESPDAKKGGESKAGEKKKGNAAAESTEGAQEEGGETVDWDALPERDWQNEIDKRRAFDEPLDDISDVQKVMLTRKHLHEKGHLIGLGAPDILSMSPCELLNWADFIGEEIDTALLFEDSAP